jgi:hypothetical protein
MQLVSSSEAETTPHRVFGYPDSALTVEHDRLAC